MRFILLFDDLHGKAAGATLGDKGGTQGIHLKLAFRERMLQRFQRLMRQLRCRRMGDIDTPAGADAVLMECLSTYFIT